VPKFGVANPTSNLEILVDVDLDTTRGPAGMANRQVTIR
jgi:hypothetical protein